ncbi:YceI family protein [Massilia sp. W12]|uniref:YceI family protein n=1 Tax=Massilia sp. W12 TaxID=3126507 RepID=UPI0030D0ACBC
MKRWRRLCAALSGFAACALLGASPALHAREFVLDASHSSIYFAVPHYARSDIRGRLPQWRANRLWFDGQQGEVEIEIDASQIDSGSRLLDKIIASEQVLDAENHPQIRFSARQFEWRDKQLHALHGELTLHGVRQPLSLRAQRWQCGRIRIVLIEREVCGGVLRAEFARSAFGIKRYLPEVGDMVQLEISIEASPR